MVVTGILFCWSLVKMFLLHVQTPSKHQIVKHGIFLGWKSWYLASNKCGRASLYFTTCWHVLSRAYLSQKNPSCLHSELRALSAWSARKWREQESHTDLMLCGFLIGSSIFGTEKGGHFSQMLAIFCRNLSNREFVCHQNKKGGSYTKRCKGSMITGWWLN